MIAFALAALLQISGEVLDPAGQPAAGATVKLWRWDGETLPKLVRPWLALRYRELATVPTGADGRFQFPTDEGRLYALTAERGGDELASLMDRVGAGRALVLRLQAPVTLTGTVIQRGAAGPQPVAGAEVQATLDDDYDWDRSDTAWPWPMVVRRTATTGKDGSYTLRMPAPGAAPRIDVVASFRGGSGPLRSRSTTTGPAPTTLELAPVPPPRVATVRLVDAASGKPVAGARGMVFHGREIVSDADGVLRHTPWAGMPIVTGTHRRVAIDLHEGDGAAVRLEAGIPVRGRLLGADGRPLRQARIAWLSSLATDQGSGFGWPWCESTDDDGRFVLGCLAPGGELLGFVETGAGFVPFLHRVVPQALDLGDVRISTQGRVSGRVLGPDGAPVARATVLVQRLPERIAGLATPEAPAPSRTTTTSATGTFVLADLAPGEYLIAATAPDLAPVQIPHVVGPQPQPVTLTLGAGETLSGVVLGPDGEPQAGVEVVARPQRRELQGCYEGGATRTDAKGRFLLRGLPGDCRFELAAQARIGNAWWSVRHADVLPPGQDLELRLRR